VQADVFFLLLQAEASQHLARADGVGGAQHRALDGRTLGVGVLLFWCE
jgi:hypothetical protein